MKNAYNIFGSSDSLDYDVMYWVDAIPKTKESCKILCRDFEEQFPRQDKKVNVNLCEVEGERITKTYKGTPDECNNAVLRTFGSHDQDYGCFVGDFVERDKGLKVDRSLRIVLSFLSRTEYRKVVKQALKSPSNTKRENAVNCLTSIDFKTIKSFGTKNGDPDDIVKQIAFQMGQTCLLLHNIEVYSKRKLSEKFPMLKGYLDRDKPDLTDLEKFKSIYLYEVNMWRQFYDSSEWRDS